MKSRKHRTVSLVMLTSLALILWWYVEAEDFADARLAGRYTFKHNGTTQNLSLRTDHTFMQLDTVQGNVREASGTWRVFSSTGHIAFSKEFPDAAPDTRGREGNEVYGIVKNYFGLVSITFDSQGSAIKAYKRLFS